MDMWRLHLLAGIQIYIRPTKSKFLVWTLNMLCTNLQRTPTVLEMLQILTAGFIHYNAMSDIHS